MLTIVFNLKKDYIWISRIIFIKNAKKNVLLANIRQNIVNLVLQDILFKIQNALDVKQNVPNVNLKRYAKHVSVVIT